MGGGEHMPRQPLRVKSNEPDSHHGTPPIPETLQAQTLASARSFAQTGTTPEQGSSFALYPK